MKNDEAQKLMPVVVPRGWLILFQTLVFLDSPSVRAKTPTTRLESLPRVMAISFCGSAVGVPITSLGLITL